MLVVYQILIYYHTAMKWISVIGKTVGYFCLGIGVLSLVAFFLFSRFLSRFDLHFSELVAIYQSAKELSVPQQNGRWNVLLLGVDTVEGKSQDFPLTDTILFLSLHLDTGEIDAFSIPRDLWIVEYKTKINALYSYGNQKDPLKPFVYLEQFFDEKLDLRIHHVFVVDIRLVEEIIDAFGGVYVQVPRSFVDELYPRSGVDVAVETNPSVLYETVSFVQGVEHMNGERAVTYMRSRHSKDVVEGTDEARSYRQRLVLIGLKERMIEKFRLLDLDVLVNLYQLYLHRFESELSREEILALLIHLRRAHPSGFIDFKSHDLSAYFVNPPLRKYNQWVYEVKDPSFQELRLSVQDFLDVKE
ncbi:MAG: Cell envelope-related transcriptional attenuator [Microgenomates group bacterium GW2011_GWF2_45_18]|nr:MAG: Cell envelope-related transcriptional attenuator [Microgenomates group bacterium GW2011_GWF2_45_18]